VDDLEVAQFLHLLLYNKKLRNVVNAVTSKAVLILGRFTPERKVVLDVIRDELRKRNYIPILFDFKRPDSPDLTETIMTLDLTETIMTLAHLARFIIADITDAHSIPQELQAIIPALEVPVQPLLQSSTKEYALFASFKKYPWVLQEYLYVNTDDLFASIGEKVIAPAEAKANDLELRKRGSQGIIGS